MPPKLGMSSSREPIPRRPPRHVRRPSGLDRRDANGNKRRHDHARMVAHLRARPYNFEFMTNHQGDRRPIQSRRIFSNRWNGSGMCYCEHCKTNFRAPPASISSAPTTRRTQPARPHRVAPAASLRVVALVGRRIRKSIPRPASIPNTGGRALSDLDMKYIGEKNAPILFADLRHAAPRAHMGRRQKPQGVPRHMGRKPSAASQRRLQEPYRGKDSVRAMPEIRMWVLDGVANDSAPWFTNSPEPFATSAGCPSWKVYQWHFRNERTCAMRALRAWPCLLAADRHHYGGNQARQKVNHTLGYYHALHRIARPLEMVHDACSIRTHRSLQGVVFPNIAALSTQQCAQIRD